MLGKVLVLIGSSAGHCGMWELRKTVLPPVRRRKHAKMDTEIPASRPDWAEAPRCFECWFPSVRGGMVRRGRRWVGGLGTCYLFLCQFFVNPLTSAQTLVACIPTYRADVCQPISEAKAAEPTQDCRPSPAHLLPSRPALALDQRQATRRGTRLMMATAMLSLSSPNPRVQFWLMLFPADKMQTSSFYFFFLTRGLGGEGWVNSSKIVLFHYQVLGFGRPLL